MRRGRMVTPFFRGEHTKTYPNYQGMERHMDLMLQGSDAVWIPCYDPVTALWSPVIVTENADPYEKQGFTVINYQPFGGSL